jgi:hypothetical protein
MDTSPPTWELRSVPQNGPAFTNVNFRCDSNLGYCRLRQSTSAFRSVNENSAGEFFDVNTLK